MSGNHNKNNDSNGEWKEEDDEYDEDESPSLYSILNLGRNATPDEIHRSYRSLSTTFHPDKIRRRPQQQDELDMEEIQETFLQFKKAHEVLIDPVLRLAYDEYGDYGVELVRRVQQQQRDRQTRRDERGNANSNGEKEEDNHSTDDGFDQEEDSDDGGEEEEGVYNLYERLEDLLVGPSSNPSKARKELDAFMEQHDYQRNLTEDNYVHLNLNMTFPPAVPLQPLLYQGRTYLRHVQKAALSKPPADELEKQYYQQRIRQEQRLVDYQISQLRSGQKADLGFTLSSVQPPRSSTAHRRKGAATATARQLQPSRWSMAIGCSTDLVYPDVAEIDKLAKEMKQKNKKERQRKQQQKQQPQQQQEYETEHPDELAQKHPVSAFVNTSYTPSPQTQIFATVNLNNDNESHQYSLGSTHTFANQTACRYGMTYLARSPLPDDAPLIFNCKTYRHLQSIGTASVGISASSGGQILQWNAKWEGTRHSKESPRFVHKASAKASIGMLQGNSLELEYKCKFPKPHDDDEVGQRRTNTSNNAKTSGKSLYEWLEEIISMPQTMQVTTVLGHFSKISATVTHQLASLATHPTLGFGMEHDVSLGRWAWIWELSYNQSTFRVPIPVLQLGSVTDPRRFYAQKFYYGVYCLLLQSMVAELLQATDDDTDNDKPPAKIESREGPASESPAIFGDQVVKTKAQAEEQLALMKPIAEKKRYQEFQLQQKQDSNDDGGGRDGLIILGATYSQTFRQRTTDENDSDVEGNGRDSFVHEIVSMDATVQLQFWVNQGRLSIPSQLPKSSWMGFYSLCTESKLFLRHGKNAHPPQPKWWSGRQIVRNLWSQWKKFRTSGNKNDDETTANRSRPAHDLWQEPELTVRYSFRGSVYEITVGDTESLELPHANDDDDKARTLLGDADFVQ